MKSQGQLEIMLREFVARRKKERSLMKRELGRLPEGTLSFNYSRPKARVYVLANGVKKGITKDKEKQIKLARRNYLELKVKEMQNEIDIADGILWQLANTRLRENVVKVEQRFEKSPISILDVVNSPSQMKRAMKQSANPFHREQLTVRTECGIYVRSFSEKDLLNAYCQLNAPVQYEQPLTIDITEIGFVRGAYYRGGRNYKTYYPDFQMLLQDGELFIHEHLGLLSKEEYRDDAQERLLVYLASGIVKPQNLLITTPKDIKDMRDFIARLEMYVN